MFLHLSVILFTGGVSVQGVGGSLSSGEWVSVQEVSVWGSLCPGESVSRGSVSRGLCPGGYLSRGISVQGGL